MKSSFKQKGTTGVLLAVALPVLIGGVGMVIDTGSLYEWRRRAQSEAETAAIAAARAVDRRDSGSVEAKPGHPRPPNGPSTSVAIHRPPTRGHYQGDAGYVEAVVTEDAPLFFLSALTNRESTVEGRAVAGAVGSTVCVWTLDKAAKHSFNATGTAKVTFTECGIFVNSKNRRAARTTGGATVSAPSIDIVGSYAGNGFSRSPRIRATQLGDPFRELAMPPVGSCNYKNKQASGATTLNPGVYCGGLSIKADAKVTLNPGVYIVRGGGIGVDGSASVAGDGVSFFNTAGGGYAYDVIEISDGATVTLTAPSSGPTKGLLFFDDRNYAAKAGQKHIFNGGSSVKLTGAMYFPNTDLQLAGTFTGAGNNMVLAAKNVTIKGDVDFAKPEIEALPPVLAVARVVE